MQAVADLALLGWVVLWVQLARAADDAVHAVARPGYALQSNATVIATNLAGAGHNVAQVPLVGDQLATPLTSAGGAADSIAAASGDLGDRIAGVALPTALAVALVPIVPVVATWLRLRLRFALRAGACAQLAQLPGGDSLLAMRALANRPPRRLVAISPDPVAAWRREDDDVVRRLADLELRLSGVRRPRAAVGQVG
jgi:hypothetical protein